MSEKKFERFGQYLILDHLLDGGMAKICRARILGEQADKIVAIKMVQEKYSKDDSFKKMFLDEIKTTFGLIHPNIVQTYNSGIHQNQLFVAMEFCDGRNLKEYLDKLKEKGFVFPIEVSAFVTIQAAQGLHYAHTFSDKLTGKPMEIIHRDISPHNIMLSFDGSVKVIDFGIAKSESNSDATQAGTIKGKLSYLAPEYLEQLKLDGRYDQFALAITLWELLCSRKLFKASNDYAVFKKIQECKVPRPSSINPNVPEELDRIILKALSKERENRYKTCEEFARDLNKFLYSHFPDFNPSDLSYFSKELFKEEIKEDREKLYKYGQIDIYEYEEEYRQELSSGSSEESRPPLQVKKEEHPQTRKGASFVSNSDGTRKENELVFDEIESDGKTKPKKEDLFEAKKPSQRTSLTNAVKKSGQHSTSTKNSRRGEGTLTTVEPRRKNKTKPKARRDYTRIHQEEVKTDTSPILKIAMLALVVGGVFFGGKDRIMNFLNTDTPVAIVPVDNDGSVGDKETIAAIINREPSSKTGEIKLKNINRSKDKVYVNGESRDISVLNVVKVKENVPLTIRIVRPGRVHDIWKDVVVEGKIDLRVRETPYSSYGYLITSRACFKGKMTFELFDEQREETVPITKKPGLEFPVSRDKSNSVHEIFLQRDGLDIKRSITFTVEENSIVDLCRLL